jgi:hypothetical protein
MVVYLQQEQMKMKLKYQKSAESLRIIRGLIFSYPDHKEEQASRVLSYLKARKLRDTAVERANSPRGPFSGLTSRELKQSRTLEPDWF